MKTILHKIVALVALLTLPLGLSAKTIVYDFAAAAEAAESDVTITSSGTSAGKNGMGTELVYPKELSDLFRGNFGFFFRSECTVSLSKTESGLAMKGSKDTYISLLNLKQGDKVTVTVKSGSVLFCDKPVTNIEGVTDQWTPLESDKQYTLTADGNFNLQWKKSKTVISKIEVETSAAETVSNPGINITGVDGINRIVTITPGNASFGSTVTTYYTTDGNDPTKESDVYNTPLSIDSKCTVKAISMLEDGTSSEIAALEVEAGTSIKLAATATLYDITEAGVAYKFGVSNTNLIGSPEITYGYIFNGMTGSGTEFVAPTSGKLAVTANAIGYETSDTLNIDVANYEAGAVLDFSKEDIVSGNAEWTLAENTTRFSMWPKLDGNDYPYWTPTTDGKGKIEGVTVIPGENLLLKTIGFCQGAGSRTFSIADLNGYNTAIFIVRGDRMNEAGNFNVGAESENDTISYNIPNASNGFALKGVKLYKKASSIPAAENIAALKALADGTEATLTLNKAKVLVSRGSMTGRTAVVEDESGVIAFGADLMGMLMEYEVTEGKAVTGKITGVYTVVNGIPTFAGSENTGSESAGDAVTAVEDFTVQGVAATIADAKKAENLLKVVTIKDLTLSYNNTGMREFTAISADYKDTINVVDAMMTPSWSYVTDEYMKEDEEGYNFPPFESMTALVYADANGTVLYPMELVAKVVREARVWHFDQLTAADEALLEAEVAAGTWTVNKKRYQNTNAPFNNEVIAINGTELETTKGLLFTAEANKLLLGSATGSYKFMQAQKGTSFVVTDLVAGDTLRAVVQTAGSAEATLAAIDETLAKVVEGFEPTTAKETCTIVMLKDGEVKLTGTGDIRFFTLEAIPGEAPAADGLTIAEIKALADGTDATLAVNGTKVTFVSGTDAYIEDETGALLIEGEGLNLTAGKAITGTINGKLTIVKEKLHKFVATEANVTEADAQIAATVLTIAEANKPENISKLVKLENVNANLDWQTIEDNDGNFIMFMDKYNVLGGENPKKVESIVGVLGFLGTNTNMFYPVSKDSIVAAPVVPAKEVKTIAEMKAVEDGTEVNFVMNNVKVTNLTYSMKGYFATLEDETGAIMLNPEIISSVFMEKGISEGMTVSGHVTGTYTVVDGIPTLGISENTGAADELTGTEATITPTETTIAGVKNAESISKYVILKDVKVTGVEEGWMIAYTATQGDESIAMSDVLMNMETMQGALSKYVEYGEEGTTINLPEMFESMTAIVSLDENGNYVLYPKAVVEKEAQEEIAVVWDFTKWSEETVSNLKADAATVEPDADGTYPAVTPWRSYEKVGGPTDTDPDRGGAAFWYGTKIEEAQSLKANGTEIAETAGLLFDNVAAGALAIAVDYPSTTLGTYAGPSYLWIGGKNNSFTIPAVKPGSTIEIKLESHKAGDARGVKLSVGGEVIGEAIPTSAETFRIVVPASDAKTVDVKVENTNGCHIYTIGINDYEKINTGISSIKSEVKAVSGVYTINGVKVRNAGESLDGLAKGLYIIDGKKVVIK